MAGGQSREARPHDGRTIICQNWWETSKTEHAIGVPEVSQLEGHGWSADPVAIQVVAGRKFAAHAAVGRSAQTPARTSASPPGGGPAPGKATQQAISGSAARWIAAVKRCVGPRTLIVIRHLCITSLTNHSERQQISPARMQSRAQNCDIRHDHAKRPPVKLWIS